MLLQRVHCRTFKRTKMDHLVTCEIELEFLCCSHEQAPHACNGFSIVCSYSSPAEAELHFRPCAHSDFSAEASNRDNPRADRLLLIGSPGQGEPGKNPFHASPEDVTFRSMNHAKLNPTELL